MSVSSRSSVSRVASTLASSDRRSDSRVVRRSSRMSRTDSRAASRQGSPHWIRAAVRASSVLNARVQRLGQIRPAGIGLTQCAGGLVESALERPRGACVGKLGDEIGFAAGQTRDVGVGRLIVAADLVKYRLRLAQATAQAFALRRCCGDRTPRDAAGISEFRLRIGDGAFENNTARVKLGDLRREVGFARDSADRDRLLLSHGRGGPDRARRRRRRASVRPWRGLSVTLNLAIEFGFTLRGLLARRKTLACRSCHPLVECRLRFAQVPVQAFAFVAAAARALSCRCCASRNAASASATACSRSAAALLNLGELRGEVGFACGQPIAIGYRCLMIAANLIERAGDPGERLFDSGAGCPFALNLAIEFGFTLRGLLARYETLACRPVSLHRRMPSASRPDGSRGRHDSPSSRSAERSVRPRALSNGRHRSSRRHGGARPPSVR